MKPNSANNNTTAAPQSTDNYKQVLMRNSFYQDRAHRVITAVVLSGVANVIMALAIIVFIFNPPPAEYIVANPDGSLIKAVALDKPQRSSSMMQAFAANAVTSINTLDWANYGTQLQNDASKYFTNQGWNDYYTKLLSSNTITYLTTNKMIMSAVPQQVPQIVGSGVLNGRYTWKIQVPILVTYKSGGQSTSTSKNITMVIQQVDYTESPQGVGIVQYLSQ